VQKESGNRKSQCRIQDLLADGRCNQAVLDLLSTTGVGRLVPDEEDAGSEVSKWKLREHREREERSWVSRGSWLLEGPLFIPTPSFMASAEEE